MGFIILLIREDYCNWLTTTCWGNNKGIFKDLDHLVMTCLTTT